MTGAVPLADLTRLALLTNGAARVANPYRLATWAALLNQCQDNGPAKVLRLLREHEASVGFGASTSTVDPDDATVAYCVSLQPPELSCAFSTWNEPDVRSRIAYRSVSSKAATCVGASGSSRSSDWR